MKKTIKACCFFAIFLSFYSCKDEYTLCNTDKTVNFRAGFYRKVSGADVATPVPALTVTILNTSPAIYNNQPNTATFIVPLNPVLDSTRYVVQLTTSGLADTITVVYTSRTENLSYDCGNIIYNNVTKFYTTTHDIDSVRITKSSVINDGLENAKIWY